MSKITVKQAGDLLHERAAARQRANPTESYPEALQAVMARAENKELVEIYSERGGQVRGDEVHAAEHATVREKIGDRVDRLTKEYMAAKNETDYAKAMNAILAANSDLKEQYANARGRP